MHPENYIEILEILQKCSKKDLVWPACSLMPCKVISQKVLQLRHSLVSAKKKSWQDERLFNQDYQKNSPLYFTFFNISAQSMTIYNEYNVTSIGCFHCTSIGGDNPACEDPFNSTEAFEKGLYKDNCLAGLKGRGGLYPATACIKFDGYYSKYFSSIFMNASWIMKNSKVARPEGRKFFSP